MEGTKKGQTCNREGCKGKLYYPPIENCSCHINPPCNACIENKLTCPECGWEIEEEV
jgi:hypothetical protein